MSEEFGRRERDKDFTATVAFMAKKTSQSFWGWFREHNIDSLMVLAVTLWLTVKVIHWALDFPYDVLVHKDSAKFSGTDVAAIIASVLAPWGLAQAALVKWYIDLRAKNGHAT